MKTSKWDKSEYDYEPSPDELRDAWINDADAGSAEGEEDFPSLMQSEEDKRRKTRARWISSPAESAETVNGGAGRR